MATKQIFVTFYDINGINISRSNNSLRDLLDKSYDHRMTVESPFKLVKSFRLGSTYILIKNNVVHIAIVAFESVFVSNRFPFFDINIVLNCLLDVFSEDSDAIYIQSQTDYDVFTPTTAPPLNGGLKHLVRTYKLNPSRLDQLILTNG